MMKKIANLFLVFLFLAAVVQARDIKVKDGEEATLRGVIQLKTFEVSPELELGPSQTGYVFVSDDSYTIQGVGLDGKPLTLEDQKEFQLAIEDNLAEKMKSILNKPVEAKGSFFFAHTRHHRTPALLAMKSLKFIPKK